MKCYRCGGFLYESDYCVECGADVAVYKKIVKKSNELYNRGLELARDRNLSKAIECLEISLRMYKANINARNLLGLIYVERGEYALGLAQWIVSKSQQSENNLADRFLNELQNTRQDLHLMNFTIRKYNKAMGYVDQGNYDLAEIQLKKLLNDNSHMVKAYQLLGLFLIRKEKYAEAKEVLERARRIDQGDPITISYINTAETMVSSEEEVLSPTELRNKRVAEKKNSEKHAPLSGDDVIIPKSSYHEYNPATMTILQILIGVVIGAAIIFFAVTPAKTRALRSEYQAQIQELNATIEQLKSQNDTKETDGTGSDGTEGDTDTDQDAILAGLAKAQLAVNSGDSDTARAALNSIDQNALTDEQKSYYDSLDQTVKTAENAEKIQSAIASYGNSDFNTVVNTLLPIYESGSRDSDVLYFLGRSYAYLNDSANAIKYLQEYVNTYPGNEGVSEVQELLNELSN